MDNKQGFDTGILIIHHLIYKLNRQQTRIWYGYIDYTPRNL